MTQFFQSPSDKARFEVLLKVLSEETPNLAIIGEDEMALAHYGRAIHQRLSQLPHAQVDLWGAVDSEQLVNRFNDILSELTLEQAQDKAQKTPTRRCFIITDAHAVPTLELQLLARLIQGFPASHVHAVLLVNRNEAYQKKLEVFGKTLLRWELESEHPKPSRMQRIETRDAEEPTAAVNSTASVLQARQAARAAAASAPMPAAAGLTTIPPVSGGIEPALAPWTKPSDSVMPELDVSAPGDMASQASTREKDPAPPTPRSRLGWGLLLSLLVTLSVLGVMNRERIAQEFDALQAYVSGQRTPKTGTPPAEVANEAAPRVGMSSTNQLPVKADDSLIPDKETIVAPASTSSTAAPALAAGSPVTSGAVPANNTPATPAAVAPATAAPKAPASAAPVNPPAPAKTASEPTPAATPAPPAAAAKPLAADRASLLAESRQWVRDLPANGWVLQHAALETLEEAKTVKSGTPGLQEARILLTQRKVKGYYYIVVTGPYPNRATAEGLMKKNAGWAKAWLRGPKSMQQQFEE